MTNIKKYVIFGGTGFLGKSIIDELVKKNNNIIYLITRNKSKANHNFSYLKNKENFKVEQIDVNNLSELLKFNIEFDYAINLVTDSRNSPKLNKIILISQMINTANNILLWTNKYVKKKYFYASSGAVYQDMEKIETNEISLDFSDLSNAYGDAKLLCEKICVANFKKNKLSYVIGRIFSVAGWHTPLDNHFAFGNFLKNLILYENISLSSSGLAIRSFIDQRDFAVTINKLLTKKTNHNIYNIGSEEILSIYDLAKIFSTFRNLKIISKKNYEKNLRDHYVPNLERIKKEKLLSQRYSIHDTIKDSLNKLVN